MGEVIGVEAPKTPPATARAEASGLSEAREKEQIVFIRNGL